ncbi:CRISPR-associated Cas2 family protein [Nitrospirillum amazonense]|uniref:CRISPR-associated endoribonuclease Cas2 n=1 Tax=Nitrospirillum amazonense TaxID=28077 RepID=A0A560FBR8_9PROT|nr:CRISPR-associated endonuclease Cas2 [Nitrospirillum amazonense]TWB19015.1 CRISPR-associated Cas2 family protein [Nitrospirillum amazonense]
MMVLFDLPVLTKPQRRAASRFRLFLLDQGFHMAQFSVYLRWCVGKEQVEALSRKVAANIPSKGSVQIVTITDKQYQNIGTYDGKRRKANQNPAQLALF